MQKPEPCLFIQMELHIAYIRGEQIMTYFRVKKTATLIFESLKSKGKNEKIHAVRHLQHGIDFLSVAKALFSAQTKRLAYLFILQGYLISPQLY
jgi:hypothetical protein